MERTKEERKDQEKKKDEKKKGREEVYKKTFFKKVFNFEKEIERRTPFPFMSISLSTISGPIFFKCLIINLDERNENRPPKINDQRKKL